MIYKMNLPNAVSMIRLLMAPVMITLALNDQAMWFIAAVLFAGFTDVLDGYLARTLDQITEFGSHLDSWGDFAVYSCMAMGAWLLWPEIVLREKFWFFAIVMSFTVPVIVGLVKFHKLTSYHSISVKIAVLATYIGYLLLFTEVHAVPFRIAALLCVIAGIEEIVITLLLDREQHDIRTFRQALNYHKTRK